MDTLAAESWTWYSIAWVVVIARWISQRLLRGSLKKLQLDDALMIFTMVCDTVLMIGMNIISHTNTNLIDPGDPTVLTPESVKEREFGSKIVLVVEQMQCLVIWTIKACLLILYSRFTVSLKNHVVVKIVAAYVGVSFVAMEILYFGVWCRQFPQYWAVPPKSTQCSAATNHLITNAVLNISSDIMIICIPLPMLIQSQLPLKRKAVLCVVFALGVFTTFCAILNKYYSFTRPFGSDWTFWYIRESSTSIIVGNLPLTWPLIRRISNSRSFNGNSTNTLSQTTTPNFGSGGLRRGTLAVRRGNNDASNLEPSESEERINKSYSASVPLKIYCHQEFQVHSHPLSADTKDGSLTRYFPRTGLLCTMKTSHDEGDDVSERRVTDHSSVRHDSDPHGHV